MATISSPFRVEQHALRFKNNFEFEFAFDLPFLPPINLGEIVYGLCGGMCFSVLDYISNGLPVPSLESVPEDGSEFYRYLWKRQIDSFVLPIVPLRVFEWMLLSDERVHRRTAEDEFQKVLTDLHLGLPVVISLIRGKGVSNPTKNHQVLVHHCSWDESSGEVEFLVYDPNHPPPEPPPRITFNISNPEHSIEIEQSTGEDLRGFFVIPYKPDDPPDIF